MNNVETVEQVASFFVYTTNLKKELPTVQEVQPVNKIMSNV